MNTIVLLVLVQYGRSKSEVKPTVSGPRVENLEQTLNQVKMVVTCFLCVIRKTAWLYTVVRG